MSHFRSLAFLALLVAAACGGGGGTSTPATQSPATATPTATASASPTPAIGSPISSSTPVPTATPTPNVGVQLKPNPLALTYIGETGAVAVSQLNYSGSFTVTAQTCTSMVATISPQTTSSSFTVTAQGPNNPAGEYCTFTIAGGNGYTAQLQVGVTTTGGTISVKKR